MKSTKPKKPRTFFKSHEIAHQWAHQLVPFARSPGNMSFNGPAFLSYSTVIARIITYKGKKAFVLDRASFSISTSRHQSEAWQAIPGSEKVFHVRTGRNGNQLHFTPQTLRDHYLEKFKEVEDSKYGYKRHQDLLTRLDHLGSAIEVCTFFKLPKKSLENTLKKFETQATAARAFLAERARKLAEADSKRVATRVRNIEARANAIIADPANPDRLGYREQSLLSEQLCYQYRQTVDAEKLKREEAIKAAFMVEVGKYIKFDGVDMEKPTTDYWGLTFTDEERARIAQTGVIQNREKIRAWRAGEGSTLPYDCPVMLRVNTFITTRALMETSKGVTVPLADAERAFKFIDAIRRGRGEWHKNGTTFAIGQFQLDAVNAQGVVAGCHRVTWAEVDRFAASVGWSQAPAAVVT